MNGISKRHASYITALILLASILLCAICFWDAGKIAVINADDYQDGSRLKFRFDSLSFYDGRLTCKGWVVYPQKATTTFDTAVVLYDPAGNDLYELPTQFEKREAEEIPLHDGTDYTDSGFVCNAFIGGLPAGTYEICIAYRNNALSMLLYTGRYIGPDAAGVSIVDVSRYKHGKYYNVFHAIDTVELEGDVLSVSGWAVLPEKPAQKLSCLLYDPDSDTYFSIHTESTKRQDLAEVFRDGTNYEDAGFLASVPLSKYDLTGRRLEVCLAYHSDRNVILIHTDRFWEGDADA